MLASTMVPASASATKKMKIRKSATSDVSRASGYWPRNSKSATVAPPSGRAPVLEPRRSKAPGEIPALLDVERGQPL